MTTREKRYWTVGRAVLASVALAGALLLWTLPDHYRGVTLRSADFDVAPGVAGAYRCPVPADIRSQLRWILPPRNSSFLFEDDRLLWFTTQPPRDPPPVTGGWHAVLADQLLFATSDGSDPRANGRAYHWETHGPLQGWRLAGWCAATVSLLGLGLVPGAKTAVWLSRIIRGWLAGLAAWTVLGGVFCEPIVDRVAEATSWRWLGTRLLAHAEDHGPAAATVLALAGALSGFVAWRRGEDAARAELRLRAWLIRWGGVVVALLCLLSWWKLSAFGPGHRSFTDAAPFSSPFGERLAWGDALDYASGTLALIDTGQLDEYSQRRPINACLAAARLLVTGFSPIGAALLQTVLLGGALYFAVAELARRYGSWTALAAWGLLWGYARFFLGTSLSETLGLTLGAYGLGLLLRGADTSRPATALFGLFAMALGQAARPGALFALPAIGCWIAWRSPRTMGRRLGWLCLAALTVLAGLGTLSGLNRLYGTGANVAGANFAYTLAGLATGQGWDGVLAEYERELQQCPTEAAKARFLYAEAWRQIRSRPSVLVSELGRGMWRFTSELFPAAVMFAEHAAAWSSNAVRRPLLALLMIFALGGCARTMTRGHGLPAFWLSSLAGVAMSAPFVLRDGGWRVFASVWPLLAGWLAISLAVGRRLPTLTASRHASGRVCGSPLIPHGVILAAVVLAAAVAPAVAHRLTLAWTRHDSPTTAVPSRLLAEELDVARSSARAPAMVESSSSPVLRLRVVPRWSTKPLLVAPSRAVFDGNGSGSLAAETARRNSARVISWREFQRRLQHSGVLISLRIRDAAEPPPAVVQQSYDVLTHRVVCWCRPIQSAAELPPTDGPPYGVEATSLVIDPVVGHVVLPIASRHP